MPSVRVVLRRYAPGCGLATTDHSASGTRPETAKNIRRVEYAYGSRNSKIPNYSVRRTVMEDADSDQVELCEYNPK